jgi:hypothetical protein
VVRYTFIAVDFHLLLLAGLPAHSKPVFMGYYTAVLTVPAFIKLIA